MRSNLVSSLLVVGLVDPGGGGQRTPLAAGLDGDPHYRIVETEHA
jgi:hypothetical protein